MVNAKKKKGTKYKILFKLVMVYFMAAFGLYTYHGFHDFQTFSSYSQTFDAKSCGEGVSEWTCYNMKWQNLMAHRKTNYLGLYIGYTYGMSFVDDWAKKQKTKDELTNLLILDHYAELYDEVLSKINQYDPAEYAEAYLPISLAEKLGRATLVTKIKPKILSDMQAKGRFLLPQVESEEGREVASDNEVKHHYEKYMHTLKNLKEHK